MPARRPLMLLPLLIIASLAIGSPILGQAPTPPSPGGLPQAPPAVSTAPPTAPLPLDPQVTSGTLPERPALLRPREQRAGEARRAAAGGERGLGPRRRRPAGARPLRRAHGVQRHRALPEAASSSRSSSRSACGSAPSSTRTRASTRRSTCSQIPTDKAGLLDDRRSSSSSDWADGITFDPAEIDKERGVVIEEWRLGRGAARAHPGHSSCPCSSRARATPSGCRSASRRSSKAFSTSGCARSTATGTGPTSWRWSRSATSTRPRSKLDPRSTSGRSGRRLPRPRVRRYDVPDHAGHALRDRHRPGGDAGPSVGVFNKLPARDQATVGAYRQDDRRAAATSAC